MTWGLPEFTMFRAAMCMITFVETTRSLKRYRHGRAGLRLNEPQSHPCTPHEPLPPAVPQISRVAWVTFCEEREDGDMEGFVGGLTKEELELKRRLQKAVMAHEVRSFATIFEVADRHSEVRQSGDSELHAHPSHPITCVRCQGHVSESQLAHAIRALHLDFSAREVSVLFKAASGRHQEMDLSRWLCVAATRPLGLLGLVPHVCPLCVACVCVREGSFASRGLPLRRSSSRHLTLCTRRCGNAQCNTLARLTTGYGTHALWTRAIWKLAVRAHVAVPASTLQTLFYQFDVLGSGTISKEHLYKVITTVRMV